MLNVGTTSDSSAALTPVPSPLTAAGSSSPPKLEPSSVMCQLIVNDESMSSKRSIDVSITAWSPKRTSRTSTVVSPAWIV